MLNDCLINWSIATKCQLEMLELRLVTIVVNSTRPYAFPCPASLTPAALTERYSNSTDKITESQSLACNRNIQGSYDGAAIGQRVCKGAPGGTFPSPVATITALRPQELGFIIRRQPLPTLQSQAASRIADNTIPWLRETTATPSIYSSPSHLTSCCHSTEDVDFVNPVEEYDELWHSLEAVLSNWIYMVQIKKITASQEKAPNEKFGPWTWHPYSKPQVASTIITFEQLVTTIEERMPVESYMYPAKGPLLSNKQIDAASIPGNCFVRSFATRARKPRFRMIVLGLEVPHRVGLQRYRSQSKKDYMSTARES
ncbi:hypothetical protein F4680DRAFT_443092 [Xylaria scruposa]|nr:hypothetical protein F4680DRAFT_443092 [Xylaria scruposa]